MAAKRFHIARPDQLQSLVKYVKNNACTVSRTARIWATAKNRKGSTRCDENVYVTFSGDRSRQAILFRFSADNELVEFGTLKYNLALVWCEQHLCQVYD